LQKLPTELPPIKSLNGLCQKGQRFKNRLFNIGKKMMRNPSRAEFIPSLEQVEQLMDEHAQLMEIKKSFAKAQNQFDWDMYDATGVLKGLLKIAVAQRDIRGK